MMVHEPALDKSLLRELHECQSPQLIGVRHHSAVLARAVPKLLDQFQPQRILIEMPLDLQSWMVYIADPKTKPPIAISAVDPDGGMMFYPLAEFSPEYAAICWAFANEVAIVACDLSVSAKSTSRAQQGLPRNTIDQRLVDGLLQQTGASDIGDLWQRLVESPGSEINADVSQVLSWDDPALPRSSQPDALARDRAPQPDALARDPAVKAATESLDGPSLTRSGCESQEAQLQYAESIRRAALTFGYAVRYGNGQQTARDEMREATMRQAIRNSSVRTTAVVGSFHAMALLPSIVASTGESDTALLDQLQSQPSHVGVSLVPYSFEQLDERSGYPAGVLDPVWHQRMLQCESPEQRHRCAVELATAICRELRRQGHVAGTPDAAETVRMMRDLAGLRGLVSPGRGELVEAIQTCLVQGDLLGRGRAVSKAAATVLIGKQQGYVTEDVPACGLVVALNELLKQLGLPSDLNKLDAKELRLDVLRSPRDRARVVVLQQLKTAGIPYGERIDTVQTGHRENLVQRWRVQWQQTTSAVVDSVSRWGVTLSQVTEQVIRSRAKRLDEEGIDETLPAIALQQLRLASECGLHSLTHEMLSNLDHTFQQSASLAELVDAITLLVRIAASHLPGLPTRDEDAAPPWVNRFDMPATHTNPTELLGAAMQRLRGLRGSTDWDDAGSVIDLVDWYCGDLHQVFLQSTRSLVSTETTNQQQMLTWCNDALRLGSDLMRGVAAGSLCRFEQMDAVGLGQLMTGWLDNATHRDGRNRLRDALSGAVFAMLSPMQTDPQWLAGLEQTLIDFDDAEFLVRLPDMRAAFDRFSPADRNRLLQMRFQGLDDRETSIELSDAGQAHPQEALANAAWLREADLAGRNVVLKSMPHLEMDGPTAQQHADCEMSLPSSNESRTSRGSINTADRWRLILGVPPESQRPHVQSAARSLDQLFGKGRGEGSRGDFAQRGKPGGASRGGQEAPRPTTAQWADDLEALFGSDVCQEILGQSAKRGNGAAITHLDIDSVTPSVDLLQQVLSLAGAMPESRLSQLRVLARKITDDLAKQLAVRLQSALSGLSTPRPTRRRSRRLNLPHTIRQNLRNARRRGDGRASIVADRLIFNSPAKRELDWHITFVVDVSGSMTPSVVYSALVAAIFDALPALTVRFLAFSTELIDLSDQVADPLSLLLEVEVGGGTNIGLGLRGARAGIKVPSRSIVVLVTDFEEGVSIPGMLSEARQLIDAGVRCLGLAALDDTGTARFHEGLAQMMASVGMSVAAVSPDKLAQWVGDQIRGTGKNEIDS